MPRVRRTPASRGDYREIHDYIALDSPQNSAAVLSRFDARLEMLARNNLIGRPRPELAANLRSFPEGNYVIFYRPIDDGIELIRVLHSARDISPAYFQQGE